LSGFGAHAASTINDADTVTVTERLTVPPVPVQPSEKVAELVSAVINCEPDSALVPLQPPDALHDDAFDDDQVNVVLPLLFTKVGLALKLMVGGAPGPGLGGGLAPPGETC
jgi:hypothetical protein